MCDVGADKAILTLPRGGGGGYPGAESTQMHLVHLNQSNLSGLKTYLSCLTL